MSVFQRLRIPVCLCLALATSSPAAAEWYADVRILHLGVHNVGDANIEVTFDKRVCANWVSFSNQAFLMGDSPNRALLLSIVMAAFTSYRPVRIQTADDASCRVLAIGVSK
jgi:hypothetical protein